MVEYTDPGIGIIWKGVLLCEKKRKQRSTFNEKGGGTILCQL